MLKNRKINKILFLETNSEDYAFYRNMYLTLGKFCEKMLHFDRRNIYFKYGKKEMNKRLLNLIQKEKPEYVFTWLTWDEFDFDTLLKIKEVSPKTKTVALFGDDVTQFDDFAIYYSLFFDYILTTVKRYIPQYNQDGIKNVFYTSLTDTNISQLGNKKKYDVTFIGSEKSKPAGRYDYLKFLMDNGINLKIFGADWAKYPELKNIFGGINNSKELMSISNQSKINLCFSKTNFGAPQMKARFFEISACKAFTLCEYAEDYPDYFKEGKEIVFFKTKKELLDKINYFLKNEKEREKIANAAHKRTLKEYSLFNELDNFFEKTYRDNNHNSLPKTNKKTFTLTKKQINLNINELKNILEGFDYVSFKKGNSENLKYKNFFQVHSLEKTNKPISCCNYYLYSKHLGDYMLFFSRNAYNFLDYKSFLSLLDINQLIVRKSYFLDNLHIFKRAFLSNKIDFINKENTAFIAIPLVRLKKLKIKNYDIIKPAFGFKFMYKLYSLMDQKKLFFNKYPYLLFIESLKGNLFILKHFFEIIFDKTKWIKLKKLG